MGTDQPPAPRRRPADPACRGATGDGRRLRPAAAVRPGRAGSRGEMDAASLYRLAARLGLDYGGRFRTVRRIELLGAGEAVAQLDPSVIDEPLAPYIVHPALLDGALQGLLALIADKQAGHCGDLAGVSFLPWRFGRVRAPAPFGRVPHSARLRVTRIGTRSASADICPVRRGRGNRRRVVGLLVPPGRADAAGRPRRQRPCASTWCRRRWARTRRRRCLRRSPISSGRWLPFPTPRPPRKPNRNCCWTR